MELDALSRFSQQQSFNYPVHLLQDRNSHPRFGGSRPDPRPGPICYSNPRGRTGGREEEPTGGARRRISVACARCRKRKIRCSGDPGDNSGCANCKSAGVDLSQCQFHRVCSLLPLINCSHNYRLDRKKPRTCLRKAISILFHTIVLVLLIRIPLDHITRPHIPSRAEDSIIPPHTCILMQILHSLQLGRCQKTSPRQSRTHLTNPRRICCIRTGRTLTCHIDGVPVVQASLHRVDSISAMIFLRHMCTVAIPTSTRLASHRPPQPKQFLHLSWHR